MKKNFIVMKSLSVGGVVVGSATAIAFSFLLNAGTAAMAVQTVIFDTSKNPEVNLETFSFPLSGVTLNVLTPTGTAPGFTTLNSAPTGFCAFADIGTTASRCNYGPDGSAGNPGTDTRFNGFTFSFTKAGELNSVAVSRLLEVSTPSITFTAGTQTQTFTNFSQGDTFAFSSPFVLAANESVIVTTSGNGNGGNGSGVIRVNNFNFTDVPGPVGYLGVAAAFRYSRKLKAKLSK